MATIVPIREGVSSGADGSGPEDPMLEQRVARLEDKLDRIEAVLTRLEPKITEMALTGAKQQELHKTSEDIAELKGKIAGVEARFSSLPTTWTMLGIVFTTWALGSGILIFAMNYFKK